ncbi:MAG: family 43 glycosylhydrolase [Lachnospiraceae bacterium]|jgi:arabinoxylan arabinofuranohydrolase|nr:family 43 glycosylhydrolase [Lachnospiraceae bacterium]
MKALGLNPYLPSWEFVPDGEPHVFDGRVYLYGSHDSRNGVSFCEGDYVVWSAPVDDLGNWRCEGVSYRKDQDPLNGAPYEGELPMIDMPLGTPENPHLLYAPDVAKGPDGRYYLYYSLDFTNVISVAVSNTPAGPYEFLDYVRTAKGEIPNVGRWFDPAILSEENGNYLYYGFAPKFRFPGMEDAIFPGAMMVRLADDMYTIISDPVCVANGIDTAKGTGYKEHPFFEASSIRRIGDWYYFVYSSLQGHELCYGRARTPEGPFTYQGVIVSNGDLGYQGNELAVNYTGNNHGGLAEIDGEVYIFWHRQTHGTGFSRQGCADRVQIAEDGTIPQIEITSCGLNGGPLPAKNTYQSYIACHLTEKNRSAVGHVVEPAPGEMFPKLPAEMPYITEEENTDYEKGFKPYITNLREGAVAGFKYFDFDGDEKEIALELRGTGKVQVLFDSPDGEEVSFMTVDSAGWEERSEKLKQTTGVHSVYVKVTEGTVDFAAIRIV